MVTIAVAGGTGGIGRAVVDALLATRKHEVKIFSRKPNPSLEAELGIQVIPVDYDDVVGLAQTLEANNVHTVISTLNLFAHGPVKPKEVELIRAADASKTTKRMISSDYTWPQKEEDLPKLPFGIPKQEAHAALKATTDLETTTFQNGHFMDYWGVPKCKSYMPSFTLILDMLAHVAAIPGDGNTPAVFTHTTDLAKFVAAVLDLDEWEPRYYVVGDRITWNEFLRLAEGVKGRSFEVSYDSLEKLERGEVTELPTNIKEYAVFPKPRLQKICAQFGVWFADGSFNMKPEKVLNDVFPQIKAKTIKDMLEEGWKAA